MINFLSSPLIAFVSYYTTISFNLVILRSTPLTHTYSDLKIALTTLIHLRDSQRNELNALKNHKKCLMEEIVNAQKYNQDPPDSASAETSDNTGTEEFVLDIGHHETN